MIKNGKVLAAFYFSSTTSYYYFHWDGYQPDIQEKKLNYSMPELEKIVLGDIIYNVEELLKIFSEPHDHLANCY
jgi:hypothetical protein